MDIDTSKIGFAFEKHVLSCLDLKRYNNKKKADYKIVSWTGDYGKNEDYSIERDSEPDLIIRHLESDTKFAIECKYRSNLSNDGRIGIGRKWFLDQYKEYADKNQEIPTFIVFGLEGQPNNPDRMFCVPIRKIRIANTLVQDFEDYERNPRDMFSFNPSTGVLK